jgi:ABC-type multidrug transport system ATPase subunit
VLIVDEPTAGLDPEERIRFRNLLVRMAADRTVLLSTHIVEDIGQTCRDIAVLAAGRVIFRGSPAELSEAARGHVWTATVAGLEGLEKIDPAFTIVSMMHLADAVEMRLVGPNVGPSENAEAARPGLEDGYVRLMQQAPGARHP